LWTTTAHLPQTDVTVKIHRRKAAKSNQPLAFVIPASVGSEIVSQNDTLN